MQKISPFIWFDNNAEEAMNFYLSIFEDSKVVRIAQIPPGGPGAEGAFLVATIELEGQEIHLMNGGPGHPLTDAVSLLINCNTQEEIDYYWNKLTEGGEESMCGWLKDKFGLSWQVVPTILPKLLQDPAKSERVMKALMQMRKFNIEELKNA